jgi:hypothetical protein
MPTIITRGAVSAKAYGFGVSGGYSVGKSLRFRSSASAYLSRTPSVTGNRQIWTWSGWVKRGALTGGGATQQIFGSNYSAGGVGVAFGNYSGSGVSPEVIGATLYGVGTVTTTPVYRDPSAWYHIVIKFDSTQATQANRFILYVNGVQQTLSAALNVTQNANYNVNLSGAPHSMFGDSTPNGLDGYLAEVNFIDGQALTPSSFGAYDTNGVWQPIKYAGTYGTNGFYLNFGNTTSTTTLGNDFSGNSNTWTVNNVSLTAGSTYDSMTDSPTVTSASVANYAVLNPLNGTAGGIINITNANLTVTISPSAGISPGCYGSIGMPSGKWYWEVQWQSGGNALYNGIGITNYVNASGYRNSPTYYLYLGNPYLRYDTGGGTVNATYGTAWSAGDIIGVAFDASAGTLTFYRNGTSQGTAATGIISSTWYPLIVQETNANTNVFNANFGQRPFSYTPPTGFNPLNTYNLPTPTIANGAQYMAATLYTGTGASNAISNGTNTTIGTTFQPDFVWTKSRNNATQHLLYDSVRGTNTFLFSASTSAEVTQANTLTSFNSNGYTVGLNDNSNASGSSGIGWQWKANGSGVSNTNGSITSTVSANTTAGFSVVTFTSLASGTSTIGHGLGVAPNMIFLKTRNTAADWVVYHSAVSTSTSLFLKLDTTDALLTSAGVWGASLPTSSVFGITNASTIPGSATAVAYCWAAVPGFSAFGSYTGNGSTDGPFCYTGFRPRFVFVKETVTVSNWNLWDSSRNPYNVTNLLLRPNLAAVENTAGSSDIQVDFLANGFKIRGASTDFNTNGETIIYAAFAENPFQSSRAR